MSHPYTIRDWKVIQKEVSQTLKDDKALKPTVYFCKDGFIQEVSFVEKHKKGQSYGGFSYMSDQCSQGLLKRIAALIPKKRWEKL